MRVHFIAIGGSAMHNLAIALHKKGYIVSGSDDEIREPSLTRLQHQGLLPSVIGWNVNNITPNLEAIVLGMHARADNPELLRAQELGLKIYSYPEFLYEATKDKTRIVIGGSHGKTTITAMILHVLKLRNVKFDFMVGAQIKGFDTMVELHNDTKFAIFEGDEYLASPIDRRPKFHLYHPHIAVLSGVAWDHINVFPTYEIYEQQFVKFLECIAPNGKLFYCANDDALANVVAKKPAALSAQPYDLPNYTIANGITTLHINNVNYELSVFGKHNLYNLQAAQLVCAEIGVTAPDFYTAVQSFDGAAKRLEVVKRTNDWVMFKDFAHSPSKVKATLQAVREQYHDYNIVACLELHTFSSLNENFLLEYAHTLDAATTACVYFNPQVLAHKQIKPITTQQVQQSFANDSIHVFTKSDEVVNFITTQNTTKTVFLLMSSGNFDGVDFNTLALTL
ncbi:MAG: peptidoglycan synthetase [Bacteroidia bacterium]|nr:peptidoglycan synthetase [Bacteroidia bacterium]